MPLSAAIFTCATMVYDYTNVGGVSPCVILGINSNEVEEGFLLSPNPINSSGELNLGTTINDLQIFDITGRLVADYQNVNSSSVTLDLQEAIFFVKATSASGLTYSTRLIAE